MSTIRVVFLGTPEFSAQALQTLFEDEHFEIVGVVSQPDSPQGRKLQLTPSPVKKFALEKNIPVITPENINTPEVLKQIENFRAEAAVVVAFGQILSQNFLDMFPERVVNIHTSLLPRWRGAAPIQRSIMADDPEVGVSLQKVVRKLDAGDVLGVRKFKLTDEMDAATVFAQMQSISKELLKIDFMDYLRGNLAGQKQNEDEVTYAKKIDKAESQINWDESARNIFNKVRALVLGPQMWTISQNKKLKIWKVKEATLKGDPGVVVQVGKESFFVGCGDLSLEILEVQPESRSKMAVADFLKGYPLKKGERLG